jgi:hypothetical protein
MARSSLIHAPQDTALRDIDYLIAESVLTRDAAGGRSKSYSLMRESSRISKG